MNDVLFSSASVEWSTPQDVFDQLDAEFHFTLDAAATAENAKCKRFFTKEEDGLKQDWGGFDLAQSTLRTASRSVGAKSLRNSTAKRHSCRYANSRQNRHKMVSQLHSASG